MYFFNDLQCLANIDYFQSDFLLRAKGFILFMKTLGRFPLLKTLNAYVLYEFTFYRGCEYLFFQSFIHYL